MKKYIPKRDLYLFLITTFLVLITKVVYSLPADVKPIPKEAYFPKIHSLLLQSKKSIYIIMFEMRYYPKYPSSSANRLVRDLMKAAKRGVAVEVILEQSKGFNEDNTKANKEVGKMLTASGAKVYFDSPNQITHDKLIIVDETYTVIGSTNWTYYGLNKNNESAAIITSKEIAHTFIKYFMRIKRLCHYVKEEEI